MSSTTPEMTVLLDRIGRGDEAAAGQLLPLVYEELRRQAAAFMHRERRDHTLQATALVHEAFVKMIGGAPASFASRRHFFNAAAQAMRRILVDHARTRGARKRGGPAAGLGKVDAHDVDIAAPAADDDTDYEALDVAMKKLEAIDPRRHQVVMYRYFAGLGEQEIAEMLGVTTKTVQRDWKTARLFLAAEMGAGE